MMKWLISLPSEKVIKIAKELGFMGISRGAAMDFIKKQAKNYNWTVTDLQSRFD